MTRARFWTALALCCALILPSMAAAQSVADQQRALNTLGYPVGAPDGVKGPATTRALEAFQADFGFGINGKPGPGQIEQLLRLARLMEEQVTPRRQRAVRNQPPHRHATPTYYPMTFANGAHYVLFHAGRRSSPNYSYDAGRFQLQNRAQWHRFTVALEQAKAANNKYAMALVVWASGRLGGVGELPMTRPEALDFIVRRALRDNANQNHINAALTTISDRGVIPIHCATAPEAPALVTLAQDALAIATDHPAREQLYEILAFCSDPETALGYRSSWTALAQNTDHETHAKALRAEGLAALEMGQTDLAKTQLAAMHAILSEHLPREYREDLSDHPIVGRGTIEAMLMAGLQKEAYDASALRVEYALKTDIGTVGEPKIMGELFYEEAKDNAALYLSAARVATIKDYGRYLSRGEDVWYAATLGASDLLLDGKEEQAIAAAERIAHRAANQNAPHVAAELSVIAADAAIRIGRFEAAERWIDAAISYAATAEDDRFGPRIDALLAQMDLTGAEAKTPGTVLGEEVIRFVNSRCNGNEEGARLGIFTPEINYYALQYRPGMLADLRATGAYDTLKSCGYADTTVQSISRLYCQLALLNVDDVDVLKNLNAGFDPDDQQVKSYFVSDCLDGAADIGRLDIFAPFAVQLAQQNETEIYQIALRQGSAREAIIAQFLSNHHPESKEGWYLDHLSLLGEITPSERAALLDGFRTQYTIINSGASARSFEYEAMNREAVNTGTLMLNLGLPDVAEAYFAFNETISPFDLPVTDPDTLALIQSDPRLLILNEAHARIAFARDDPAKGMAILAPIVDRVLAELSDVANIQRGRVEQVATAAVTTLLLWLDHAVETGADPGQIFQVQQALALAGSNASISAIDERLSSTNPDLLRRYQDTRRQLRSLQNVADEDRDADAILQASATLEEIEEELAALPVDQAAVRMGRLETAGAVQDRLKAGQEALFVGTQLPGGLLLSWVDGNGLQQRVLPVSATSMQQRIAAFRNGIYSSRRDDDRFDAVQSRALYDDLFGWVAGEQPRVLFLMLDDTLAAIPLAALQSPNAQWLGATTDLRRLPAVGWLMDDSPARATGTQPFFGIGAPTFAADFLTPLPETEAEVFFLAAALGADPTQTVLTGDTANQSAIWARNDSGALADAAVVSFATHGLLGRVGNAGPSEPALALSPDPEQTHDAYLTAREVYELRLNARLVILSACDTGSTRAGSALSELAAGFSYAGAHALMVSHWAVDSSATVEIMKNVAIALRQDPDARPETVLRQTIAQLSTEGSGFDHPRFWAAFFIVG